MEKTDDEILKTVQSMLGTNIKIVDREETSSISAEETLLVNGIPVKLDGNDGEAIKNAIKNGQAPSCDLLNIILQRAGILRQPIELETSLQVKSLTITTEEVKVAKNGIILNERINETKEDNYYSSFCNEIWRPIKSISPETSPTKITSLKNNLKSTTAVSTNIPINNNHDIVDNSNIPLNFNNKDPLLLGSGSILNSSSTFSILPPLPPLPPQHQLSTSSVNTSSSTSELSSFPLTKNQSSSSYSNNSSNNQEASSYFSLDTDKNSSYSSYGSGTRKLSKPRIDNCLPSSRYINASTSSCDSGHGGGISLMEMVDPFQLQIDSYVNRMNTDLENVKLNNKKSSTATTTTTESELSGISPLEAFVKNLAIEYNSVVKKSFFFLFCFSVNQIYLFVTNFKTIHTGNTCSNIKYFYFIFSLQSLELSHQISHQKIMPISE